ncbi:hypothetical protein P59_219 [Bacillus phage P59]|nr:hypothetical protein P59_219 [Bacillus phage P59]
MLFGTKKQNTLTEMDIILSEVEKLFKIKAYYTRTGRWGKNTRKTKYIQSMGTIDTRDNMIYIFGKVRSQDLIDVQGINAMYNERKGLSYFYFRGQNKLIGVRNGYIMETREPSFNLSNMQTFLSYTNNLSVE